MSEASSFDRILARLRNSEEGAAVAVYERYAARLLGVARGQIGKRLGQKVDPEDIVQSAFKSFFRGRNAHGFEFEEWDNLWAMLVVITLRKCGKWMEFFHAAKRDVQREQGIEHSDFWQIVPESHEPSPQEAVALTDAIDELGRRLKPHEQEIVWLRLQEHTVAEIAASVDLTERSVLRILKKAREHLGRMFDKSTG